MKKDKKVKVKSSSYQGTKINPTQLHPSQIKFFVFLMPMALFMILPIIYIFSTAFKPVDELFAFPPPIFVRRPTLDNFKYLFRTSSTGIPPARYLFNSLVVTVVVLISSVAVSAMAGYALSKKQFATKNLFFRINTLALMFVGTAVTIPRFMIISSIGVYNTFWAHILPGLAMPVGLFLIKQFIDQIPDSLIEAAKMDGAGEITIFKNIVIPMIAPAIATVSILAFQATWNSAEASQIYIDDETLRTFAFYTSSLTTSGNIVAGTGMAAASALVMFIPNLVIFICMQSRVMNTMAHSGIK